MGLKEALEYDYQRYRRATVVYMAKRLIARDIPIVRPAGGHAAFIDAAALCPHLMPGNYPGIGLVNALYLEGGIRAVELGSVMFGRAPTGTQKEIPAPRELVRLAFPRRVSHFDYVIEILDAISQQRHAIPAYWMTKQAPFLRHFTAHFERAQDASAARISSSA